MRFYTESKNTNHYLGIVQLSSVSASRDKGSNIEAVVLQEYWHGSNKDGAQDDSHDPYDQGPSPEADTDTTWS